MERQRVGFAQVEVGVVHHSEGYEVEADEARQMSAMWDPFDFHLDNESAEASVFAEASASGVHTLAITNLLAHYTGPQYDVLALLGARYRLPSPAKVGDTLVLTKEIAEARPSNSRPGHGIVTWKNTVSNQDGEIVLEQTATTLVGPGR